MTREEAIYCLKSYQPDAPDDMCQKCKYYKSVKLAPNIYTCISSKARDMAIQALSQEPCTDAVSRQWLMRKATERFYTTNYFNHITKMIEEAPSVNPQPYDDAISREDKKHIDGFKYWCETNEENGTITIPKFVCDEIVKILDKFSLVTPRTNCQYRHENGNCLKVGGFCTSVDDKHCPSVTQKSETVTEFVDRCRECEKMRKGHWIYDETIENWRCSKCNETPKTMGYVGTADFMVEHFKFCNHCGAKMESEDKK